MITVFIFLFCVICPAVLYGETSWLQRFPSQNKQDTGMHQMTVSKENPVAQVKTVLPSPGKDPQYLGTRGLYARVTEEFGGRAGECVRPWVAFTLTYHPSHFSALKFLALLCVLLCQSHCRLKQSTHLSAWIFSPLNFKWHEHSLDFANLKDWSAGKGNTFFVTPGHN